MASVQIVIEIDDADKKLFENTARSLGITPANALKIFIAKFNEEHGFPFEIKANPQKVTSFQDEKEVMDLIENVGSGIYASGDTNHTQPTY